MRKGVGQLTVQKPSVFAALTSPTAKEGTGRGHDVRPFYVHHEPGLGAPPTASAVFGRISQNEGP